MRNMVDDARTVCVRPPAQRHAFNGTRAGCTPTWAAHPLTLTFTTTFFTIWNRSGSGLNRRGDEQGGKSSPLPLVS